MEQTDLLIKTYKILFIGDTSVGKTNLISKYVHNKFSDALQSTICVEQNWKKVSYENSEVNFEFNDTASQEYLRSNIDSYYEEADCYVIVFDMTKKSTFDSIDNYIDLIKNKYKKQNPKVIIVGNKMDLSNKEITKKTAFEFATNKGYPICFTSAKANINLKELFTSIYKEFLENYNIGDDITQQEQTKCDCCIIF